MSLNPYRAPRAEPDRAPAQTSAKSAFLLAAIGAWSASAYWGIVAFFGAFVPGPQTVLTIVLVGLYGFRGFQVLGGNLRASQRLVLLHAVGAIAAVVQIATMHSSTLSFFIALQVIKVAINIFGALTAYNVRRVVQAQRS